MVRLLKIGFALFMIVSLLSGILIAQSEDDDSVSLGDLARYLREHKTTDPAPVPLIDNDNFSRILAEANQQGPAGILSFSIDSADNSFKVSSPDVSCSLSFSANATALISDPFALRKLPADELAKLDGPARIEGDDLEIAVHNGSAWTVREITIGLTLVHRPVTEALNDGSATFLPAVATDNNTSANNEVKAADTTVLFHLKGNAPPLSTTVFRQELNAPLPPDEDWHWAIVDAKASPPPPPDDAVNGAQTQGAVTGQASGLGDSNSAANPASTFTRPATDWLSTNLAFPEREQTQNSATKPAHAPSQKSSGAPPAAGHLQ